ncbi:MAG: hypothetical protein HQ567_20635 [Candidatus Nealsonbacteria bacterium]|nr:hypothetical protein [Candidatus Nealsonbacteria bacterium]
MKRLLLVAVALPMLSLSLSAAEPEVVFEDTFDSKPADGWIWLRENSDAWRIKDDALEIRVEPGVAHNPRCYTAGSGSMR